MIFPGFHGISHEIYVWYTWIQRVFGTALQTHRARTDLCQARSLGGLGGAGVGWDPL